MHDVDSTAVTDVVTDGPYAPWPVVDDPGTWSLERSTVTTGSGDVVVHHRVGPDPVLLVHGVAGSWTTWTPLLAETGGVGERGLVLVDLPGWGTSPAPVGAFDVERGAGILVEVLDALGLSAVDVVGHSMGAFVALHLAVAAPVRVRSLGLVSGTTTATVRAARHPWRALGTLPAFTLLRAGLLVTSGAARGLLRGIACVGLLPLVAAPVFTHVRRLDRSVLDAFVDEFRPERFTAAARAAASYDVERWRAVTCPVTAVLGRDDVFARVSDLDDLRRLLPDVRTAVLGDCGHFAHVEHPAVVAGLLGLDGRR
ncbi:alpha/beta hydrolase [Curtobacterium sp. MCSS17_007]|uniref:alpha/beta fold hydrolase n=1 Tax=Curtobacterium sp. MCSS17_007 TaxID=2175646 RepID=UPI000DA7A2C4|nr:alpha/beta hydrolase [Curtobacterium sp. MCSS17_007]WIE76921.1 alpha/beta hydrolase [Curtobacterium sp. MCSS17_007]